MSLYSGGLIFGNGLSVSRYGGQQVGGGGGAYTRGGGEGYGLYFVLASY